MWIKLHVSNKDVEEEKKDLWHEAQHIAAKVPCDRTSVGLRMQPRNFVCMVSGVCLPPNIKIHQVGCQ